jgi:heme-degrading monooxygenase HmoA
MIEIVWEYVVKEETRGQFELVYGPGGAWSRLFGRCPGFRGTTVLRDTKNPQRYLTIDIWDSEVQQEQALAENKSEYADLQAVFDTWAESMIEVGTFSLMAEGTVRPLGKTGTSKAGTNRRNHRRITR